MNEVFYRKVDGIEIEFHPVKIFKTYETKCFIVFNSNGSRQEVFFSLKGGKWIPVDNINSREIEERLPKITELMKGIVKN